MCNKQLCMNHIDITNKKEQEENIKEKGEIKHIVISGGGISGFTAYGILRESAKSGFWDIKNIRSFYGTSIGGIISVILCLQFDWDTMDDYIIKRPWNKVFKLDMYSIYNSIETVGLFDIKTIEQVFEPLFKAKDLNMNITMKEFYEKIGIEIHLYSTELNETKLVDISYKTHPDWTVIESIYCSCCLPILFSPYCKGEEIYYDGGLFNNYPLNNCCKEVEDYNEIFGIRTNVVDKNKKLNGQFSLFDYLGTLIRNIIIKLEINNNFKIKNEILIESNFNSIYNDIYSFINDIEYRLKLIDIGKNLWQDFSSNIENS